jgi:hypothetical protein
MAAITPSAKATGSFYNQSPLADAIDSGKPRFKVGIATLPDTTDAGDTTSIDVFDKFGITKVLAVEEFSHTTTNSVVKEETLVTTAFSKGILTVTVPAGTNDDKRVIIIYGI